MTGLFVYGFSFQLRIRVCVFYVSGQNVALSKKYYEHTEYVNIDKHGFLYLRTLKSLTILKVDCHF